MRKGAKLAATLTIHDVSKMTPSGRSDVAKWLRRHADGLVKEGPTYASVFTARLRY